MKTPGVRNKALGKSKNKPGFCNKASSKPMSRGSCAGGGCAGGAAACFGGRIIKSRLPQSRLNIPGFCKKNKGNVNNKPGFCNKHLGKAKNKPGFCY